MVKDPKRGIEEYYRRFKKPTLKGPVSRIRPVKPIKLPARGYVFRRRGIRLPTDPTEWLERRAVPKARIYGTLPERIVHKAFERHGFDFDFQSSLLGGRQQLGGKVADYIVYLPYGPVIVRCQSFAFHSGIAPRRKDEEDKRILESLTDPVTQKNYVVYDLWEDVIFDSERLEEWIQRYLLGNYQGQGLRAPRGGDVPVVSSVEWQRTQERIVAIEDRIDSLAEQVGYLIITIGGEQAAAQFVIDTLNVRNSSITTAKIANLAVTDAKINDLDVGKLTAGSLDVAVSIITGGSIQVGSGTKDDDLTGFIIDSTELVGQNSGTDQIVLASSTGKLTAGAGAVVLDSDGLTLDAGSGTINIIQWSDGSTGVPAYIYGYQDANTDTNWAQMAAQATHATDFENAIARVSAQNSSANNVAWIDVYSPESGTPYIRIGGDDPRLQFNDANTEIWEDGSSVLQFKSAGGFIFNDTGYDIIKLFTTHDHAQIVFGDSLASDKCAILGYQESGNIAYIGIYGDAFNAGLILADGGSVGIGLTPTANMAGLSIEAGLLTLKETTTPTADADYGKIYTKNDNKFYFQDGAGAEHTFVKVAGDTMTGDLTVGATTYIGDTADKIRVRDSGATAIIDSEVNDLIIRTSAAEPIDLQTNDVNLRVRIGSDGGVLMYALKSGANQGAAGAAADELWVDTGDQTIKLGT